MEEEKNFGGCSFVGFMFSAGLTIPMLVLEMLPAKGKLCTRQCCVVNVPIGCVHGWEQDHGFPSLPLLSVEHEHGWWTQSEEKKDFALWCSTDHKDEVQREFPGCARPTQVSLTRGRQCRTLSLTTSVFGTMTWDDAFLCQTWMTLGVNMAFPYKGGFHFGSWVSVFSR